MPQPNLKSEDYYEILGCPRNVDDAQLKKAYRKLAVKWHPDKNPDNEQATTNFQNISEAYATLSDKKKRALYNQYGKEGADASDQMPNGASGFPGGFCPGGGGAHHMSQHDAQAIFSQMFGGSDPFGGGPGPGNMSFSMGGPMGGSSGMSQVFSQSMGGGMGGRQGMQSSSMRTSRRPIPIRYDEIPNGTVVTLRGLVTASERNGDRGVVRKMDPHSGRYTVNIEDSDEVMSVRATNLLQHCQVRIHDIQSQTELNGKTATIVTWIESKDRYNVYVVSLKKFVSLKPSNVVLNKGTVGQIIGLKSRPELNGKFGTVKEWIRDSNKYDIQLSADQAIRVKVENVRV